MEWGFGFGLGGSCYISWFFLGGGWDVWAVVKARVWASAGGGSGE